MADEQFSAQALVALTPTSQLLGADSGDLNDPQRYAWPEFTITDTTIADHGDPNTVNSIAWAVAQIKAQNTGAERRGRIKIGRGVFVCNTKIKVENSIAIVGLGVSATELQFNDINGGIEFTRGDHWSAGTYAEGDYIIPDGYEFTNPTQRYRATVGGASGGTEPNFTGDPSQVIDNEITWDLTTDDPVNVFVSDFAYTMADNMTGDGLKFSAINDMSVGRLKASGGDDTIGAATTNNAMRFNACNQCGITKFEATIMCNALLVDVENPVVFPFNFGDSEFANIDILLTRSARYGIKYKGDDSASFPTINNILVTRVEIVGNGDPTQVIVPIWLEYARRNTFKHIDIEQTAYGVLEIGTAAGNNNSNVFEQFNMIPSSAQTASGEVYPYMRGIPFQTGALTPFKDITIREDWLLFPPFSAWANNQPTGITFEDDGSWNRPLAASGAIGTPSGGLVTLTLAGTVPTDARNDLSRFPVIAPNTEWPNNTSIRGNQTVGAGESVLTGDTLTFGQTSAGGANLLTVTLKKLNLWQMALRSVRTIADGILFDAQNKSIDTEDSTDVLTIEKIVAGTVQTGVLGAPYTDAGVFVRHDGVGSGIGPDNHSLDGASGAGTYVRDNAGTAWVFVG